MPTTHFASSSDLPPWAGDLACAIALANVVMLLVELRQRERGGAAIVITGIIAVCTLLVAVLRPVKIAARESVVGARVVVLADSSRSMAIAGDHGLRRDARDAAVAAIGKSAKDARLMVLGFGDGPAQPLAPADSARAPRSDLSAALRGIAATADERPRRGRRRVRRSPRRSAGGSLERDAPALGVRAPRAGAYRRHDPKRACRREHPARRGRRRRRSSTCRCRCGSRSAARVGSRATSSP